MWSLFIVFFQPGFQRGILGGTLKGCVKEQAVYPLFERHGLEAQERRHTACDQGNHQWQRRVKA